ncbi:hypothetical protein ABZ477_04870 [Microbacterium sp. NPDC019599]|uniref:hypothetical protein n=1 Tax=Microbacterium sp. NPDC019599 TaxID=3154690 RepID=UPI0033D9039C
MGTLASTASLATDGQAESSAFTEDGDELLDLWPSSEAERLQREQANIEGVRE